MPLGYLISLSRLIVECCVSFLLMLCLRKIFESNLICSSNIQISTSRSPIQPPKKQNCRSFEAVSSPIGPAYRSLWYSHEAGYCVRLLLLVSCIISNIQISTSRTPVQPPKKQNCRSFEEVASRVGPASWSLSHSHEADWCVCHLC